MPWTFAHPAAALPLRRCFAEDRLLLALVMGTLVPDLAYYVGGLGLVDAGAWGTWAHAVPGWLLLDAPLGALLAGLVVRGRAWIAAPLPQPWRRSLLGLGAHIGPGASGSAALRIAARMVLASAAGAATHLLWDGFTHGPGFFVQHWAWLRADLGQLDGRAWQVFNVLQHLSTLVGLTLLWRAHACWYARQPSAVDTSGEGADRSRARGLAVALLLSVLVGALLALPLAGWHAQAHAWVVRGVILATSLMALAYAALAVWWRLR